MFTQAACLFMLACSCSIGCSVLVKTTVVHVCHDKMQDIGHSKYCIRCIQCLRARCVAAECMDHIAPLDTSLRVGTLEQNFGAESY
jgi:hypothetical protein